ncbi:MAG TPA: hypothetical protein VGG36_01565 [Rhizomicrobium sp.]
MRAEFAVLSLIGAVVAGTAAADTTFHANNPAPIAPLSGMILYHSPTMHFAIAHPPHWTVDPHYTDKTLGPGKAVRGVAFTVAPARIKGTNLAGDTSLAVLSLPGACEASRFLNSPQDVKTQTQADRTYSYATANSAGAGNRYEETVYALAGTSPCLAVRYYIHYAAIENYPPGAVKAFDRAALMKTLGRMRRSLAVLK